jgi:hypothetical protein
MVNKPTIDDLWDAINALRNRNTNNIKQTKEQVVLDLIDAGAPVEEIPMQGTLQPIHTAAYKGSSKIVKKLIEAGADVNALTSVDSTVVHEPLYQGHLDVLKVLRENGANMKGLRINSYELKDSYDLNAYPSSRFAQKNVPELANVLITRPEFFHTTIAYYVKYIDLSEIQETIDILENHYNNQTFAYDEDEAKAKSALRAAKSIFIREQARRRKNNTMKQIKNIYEMAPPMPGMSMGGPLYQEGKEQWNKNVARARKSRKTRKARKSRKARR